MSNGQTAGGQKGDKAIMKAAITKEESLKKYNGTIEFLRKYHRTLSDEKFAQFKDDAFVFGQEAGKSFTEIFDEIHELLMSDVIPETAQIKECFDEEEIKVIFNALCMFEIYEKESIKLMEGHVDYIAKQSRLVEIAHKIQQDFIGIMY